MSFLNILNFRYQDADDGNGDKGSGGDDAVVMNSDNWADFIPEELRDDPSVSKYTDLGAFVKGHINAVGMIGKDKFVMPETDEQWADTFNRLGRPDDAAGYELTTPEGVEDAQKFDDAFNESLTTTLHGLGLSGKQAQGVNDFLYSTVTSAATNSASVDAELATAAAAELKSEYGANVDAHVEASMRVIRELGGDKADEKLDKDDLLQNPVLVRILSGIANKVLEDTGLPSGENGATKTDIQESITEAMAQPGYTDRKHAEHKGLVEKVYRLRQQLHAVKS